VSQNIRPRLFGGSSNLEKEGEGRLNISGKNLKRPAVLGPSKYLEDIRTDCLWYNMKK